MKKRGTKKNLQKEETTIGLAGNPNVGKSTVFNALTGLRQHTGNWTGKTVSNAVGYFEYKEKEYALYDLPGTYSLMAHSKEEEVARNFICSNQYQKMVVVCDAVSLERNLNLVLQILEITPNVIVCVNLLDEAKKKKIHIDLEKLSALLGVPVVGTCARSKKGLDELLDRIDKQEKNEKKIIEIKYPKAIEESITILEPFIKEEMREVQNTRYMALQRLMNYDLLNQTFKEEERRNLIWEEINEKLLSANINYGHVSDIIVNTLIQISEEICHEVVTFDVPDYTKRDRKIDRILTNRLTGIPIMLMLFMLIFWITIVGANYPSQWLTNFFQWMETYITQFFTWIHAPHVLYSMLVEGIYRTLTWVIAVMLPPMAIFFPLFTLLEDLGYLPRIAFNLDKYFQKSHACGKQALTMAMGFGCNAAAITGCRIIDSPRERLIAILTNNFVPCNGRFPTILAVISMFFVGFQKGIGASLLSVTILTMVILAGILMTLFISWVLSKTILKGVPSSFTLELPPYRKPQLGKIIIHSIFDRTLFVLGRAMVVAAPAGLIIWLLANIQISQVSLLKHISTFLDPFAHLFGLDGVILIAFLLGFPANEIVIPIILMAYMGNGILTDYNSLNELHTLLVNNGWTWVTALCTMIFSLMHFPCSTTCLTIKKETKSFRFTLLSFLIPTICGLVICFFVNHGIQLIQFFLN